MTESKRSNFAACLVVGLSSITMLWLLWRFPIPTCIGSIVLLGFLLHCVRIARVLDVAVGPDADLPVRSVGGQCPEHRTLPTATRQRLATAFVIDESPCLGISSSHSLAAKSTSGAR
jgi:hypothetical protein